MIHCVGSSALASSRLEPGKYLSMMASSLIDPDIGYPDPQPPAFKPQGRPFITRKSISSQVSLERVSRPNDRICSEYTLCLDLSTNFLLVRPSVTIKILLALESDLGKKQMGIEPVGYRLLTAAT